MNVFNNDASIMAKRRILGRMVEWSDNSIDKT